MHEALIGELRAFSVEARERAAVAVNSELVTLCWGVGHRVRTEILRDERASYGEQPIDGVAATLSAEFGRCFNRRGIYCMVRFAEVLLDAEIVSALRSQLSWTHLRELAAIERKLHRSLARARAHAALPMED